MHKEIQCVESISVDSSSLYKADVEIDFNSSSEKLNDQKFEKNVFTYVEE